MNLSHKYFNQYENYCNSFLLVGVSKFGHTPLSRWNLLKYQEITVQSRIFGFALKSTPYPFGSMPRADSSLRIMRFIHPDIDSSPSCSTAFSIAKRNDGSNLNWNGGLPILFLLDCIDILNTPVLLFICTDILQTVHTKSKRPIVLGTQEGALTNHLTEDKTMAKPNYTRKTISAQTLAAVSANGGHPANFQKRDPNHFTTHRTLGYFVPAVAKSAAEPENSNRYKAHDTPNNACFFMRESRTPKIDPSCDLFSMVACDGKGFALCCFPCVAVSQPVARYRPSLRTSAVTSKFTQGVTAMIYLFIGINRTDTTNQLHRLRLSATNEQQARAKLARDYVLFFAGQINPNRTLTVGGLTAAKNAVSISSVEATHLDTTNDNSGNRTRQISGIFLSKIPQTDLLHPFNTELAIRLRGRNKASNRTNKPRRLLSVVDCLIAPTKGGTPFTKITGQTIMKTQPNTATHAPIALSADVQGVVYA
ncbi:host cell division inhibitor Icd-like protein [Pasteurella testudinis]|uniref:host cell division inhibitor Icd-like protein n=1 Tax=Pasteurella testudinis TaxID=761 RepID=UPI004058CA5C